MTKPTNYMTDSFIADKPGEPITAAPCFQDEKNRQILASFISPPKEVTVFWEKAPENGGYHQNM